MMKYGVAVKNNLVILALSLFLSSNLPTGVALVSSSTTKCLQHTTRPSYLFLSLSKDGRSGAVINATSSSQAGGIEDARESLADLPMRQRVLQIQSRLEEIHERNAEGEKLTQEYCDSVLGLCVAAEEWESVLDILEVMKNQNLKQEHSTYRSCLQSCFEMGNGASAQEILQAMKHALVEPQPADIGLVVAAMCRNNKLEPGWWEKALELLLSNTSSDIPVDAYDAVFACMVDGRKWKEAIRLLREMEQAPSSSKIIKDESRRHPRPTLATYREVIECCVAADKAEQAVQVLLSMTNAGIQPTVYTFELVISTLAKKMQWRRALQLLDLMGEFKVKKTVLTYNTIISACARAKEVGMAKNLLNRMKKEGIKPSILTYNSLLSACASTSRWKEAMTTLDLCNRDPNCTPDIYTYTNAIRACAKGGKTERALSFYDVVRHKKLPRDSYFYAAVIEACAKGKLWKKALELLDEMKEAGIAPTGVIYSVTISACGNGGQWQKALDLLDLMKAEQIRVSLITYNSVISALAKAAKQKGKAKTQQLLEGNTEELWLRAMQLLDQMKADGIQPDGFSFSSTIACCGAEGKWEEALKLIEIMQNGGPRTRPNKIAYTTAITACGRSGQDEHALRLFRSMKDEGIQPDLISYNSLLNALRVAEKRDAAYELWLEMCASKQSSSRPDIITVTDVVATLSSGANDNERERLDQVFAEAVKLGIVFSGMDSVWEVDLSGMSFPVARAACRYVVQRARQSAKDGIKVDSLSLLTGVGVGAGNREDKQKGISLERRRNGNSYMDESDASRKQISLREYIQQVLLQDFKPPIKSFIPKRAQGTVQIDKSTLQDWIRRVK